MLSLDQVKKYKLLAGGVVDFVIILLIAVIAAIFAYIAQDLYQVYFYYNPNNLGYPSVLLATVFFAAGLVSGILSVDRKVNKKSIGDQQPQWKALITSEGAAGAIKLLSELEWSEAIQSIRYSKLGFVLYGIVKVVGYSILAFILLGIIDLFVLEDILHTTLNFPLLIFISLILVLFLSRGDLQKRYNQSWVLDSLLWELRWLESEFRKAEFRSGDFGEEEGGSGRGRPAN